MRRMLALTIALTTYAASAAAQSRGPGVSFLPR